MADEVSIKWLYPPNWSGTYDPGTLGHKRYVVQLLCTSDGTGEDEALKVKRTDLVMSDGTTPSKLVVEKIDYDIQGMGVRIGWNNMTDEEICNIGPGNGCMDFSDVGGVTSYGDSDHDVEANDIILSTDSATLGDTYDIRLTIRPK